MSNHTYKMIEVVGTSPVSIDEAVKNGIAHAARTIRHMRWFQVAEIRGHIEDGGVAHWQVTIKIGFTLDELIGDVADSTATLTE
jgi:flavin-binding protein dodecin